MSHPSSPLFLLSHDRPPSPSPLSVLHSYLLRRKKGQVSSPPLPPHPPPPSIRFFFVKGGGGRGGRPEEEERKKNRCVGSVGRSFGRPRGCFAAHGTWRRPRPECCSFDLSPLFLRFSRPKLVTANKVENLHRLLLLLPIRCGGGEERYGYGYTRRRLEYFCADSLSHHLLGKRGNRVTGPGNSQRRFSSSMHPPSLATSLIQPRYLFTLE